MNETLLKESRYINGGVYGDIYEINKDKVVKLYKRTQLWSNNGNHNYDDCDLLRKIHFYIERWLLLKATKWNPDLFPKYFGGLNKISFFENNGIKDKYLSDCSLIIDLLTGEELTYNEACQTKYAKEIRLALDYLEAESKVIWDFGRVSPHDCAVFINDGIKITDIGGWNDSKYIMYYQENGEFSNELRQELIDLSEYLKV